MTTQFLGFLGHPLEGNIRPIRALYDVDENDERFVLSVDLPGVPKEQIKIELRDAELHVSAERKSIADKAYAKFEQSFDLPPGAALEKIEAQYQDGVLRIAIPKTAEAKPRLIQVA